MRIETAMPGTVASNDSATERDEGLSSVHIRVGVAKRPQALLQAPVHFHAVLKMRTITTASSQVGVIHFRNEEAVSSFPHINPTTTAAGGKANAQHPEHMRLQLSSSPSCPATKGATPGCHRRTRRQSHQINRRDSARHQAASACQRYPNDLSDLLP